MATVAETNTYDVYAFTDAAANLYAGIESLSVTRTRGSHLWFRKESELVPSAKALVGTDAAPVTVQISSRSLTALTTVADLASQDFTVTCKDDAGATKTITLTKLEFLSSGLSQNRDAKGMYNLSGNANAIAIA